MVAHARLSVRKDFLSPMSDLLGLAASRAAIFAANQAVIISTNTRIRPLIDLLPLASVYKTRLAEWTSGPFDVPWLGEIETERAGKQEAIFAWRVLPSIWENKTLSVSRWHTMKLGEILSNSPARRITISIIARYGNSRESSCILALIVGAVN